MERRSEPTLGGEGTAMQHGLVPSLAVPGAVGRSRECAGERRWTERPGGDRPSPAIRPGAPAEWATMSRPSAGNAGQAAGVPAQTYIPAWGAAAPAQRPEYRPGLPYAGRDNCKPAQNLICRPGLNIYRPALIYSGPACCFTCF
jgi:hypothetical protein